MVLDSFSIIGKKPDLLNLKKLLESIRKYYPEIIINLLCDNFIYQELQKENYNLKLFNQFDENNNNILKILDISLNNNNNTLFLNPNVLFLDNNLEIDFDKDIGLLPYFINKEEEEKIGKYNSGFIYINNNKFVNILKNTNINLNNKFLEIILKELTYFEFKSNHNFCWRRLFQSDDTYKRVLNFTFIKNEIYYNKKKLNSIQNEVNEVNEVNETDNHLINHFNNFIFGNKLNLIIQYYNDSNLERQKEYDICMIKNLNNLYIKRVYNLKEKNTKVPEIIKNHPKYVEIIVDNRITFKNVFNFCNKYLTNEMNATGNLDIYLDYNCNWNLDIDYVLALSRYEVTGEKDKELEKIAFSNSQDLWIFKSPIYVDNCDFEIGCLGCDNAIADRINNSGYFIKNSPNKYRIIHVDIARSKDDKITGYKKNKKKPEEEGYYLLPDEDNYHKVNFEPLVKYQIICDILNYSKN